MSLDPLSLYLVERWRRRASDRDQEEVGEALADMGLWLFFRPVGQPFEELRRKCVRTPFTLEMEFEADLPAVDGYPDSEGRVVVAVIR